MMKKSYLLVLLLAFFALAACNKAVLEGPGCINAITRPLNPVGDGPYARAKSLFQNNSLNIAGLSFYRATFNDSVPLNGQLNIYQHLVALQYFNGLPILNGDIGYHFKNGVFTDMIGNKNNGVNLNAKAALSTQQVGKIFVAEAAKDGFSRSQSVKDSCLAAEFGYYNLNLSSTATSPQIVKAWKVTPANSEYPVAYIRDDNGTVISYFNGIYTFN